MFSGCVLLFRFHNIQKIVCMSSLILSGHYKFLDLSVSFALCLWMNHSIQIVLIGVFYIFDFWGARFLCVGCAVLLLNHFGTKNARTADSQPPVRFLDVLLGHHKQLIDQVYHLTWAQSLNSYKFLYYDSRICLARVEYSWIDSLDAFLICWSSRLCISGNV